MQKTIIYRGLLRIMALGVLLLLAGKPHRRATQPPPEAPSTPARQANSAPEIAAPSKGNVYEDGTSLSAAAQDGNDDLVRFLLKHDAKIDADHGAALVVASRDNRLSTVKLLLKSGANIHLNDYNGYYNALLAATENGNTEVVEYLVRHGANVNARDDTGNSALAVAEDMAFKDVVALLKKAGAKRFPRADAGE